MDEKGIDKLLEQKQAKKEEEKARLRALYLGQIEDYCNLSFKEDLPAGVALALEELVKTDPGKFNIAAEKLSDMAVTYQVAGDGLPDYIRHWLNPYRRAFILSNKKEREYRDDRI